MFDAPDEKVGNWCVSISHASKPSDTIASTPSSMKKQSQPKTKGPISSFNSIEPVPNTTSAMWKLLKVLIQRKHAAMQVVMMSFDGKKERCLYRLCASLASIGNNKPLKACALGAAQWCTAALL